MVCHAQALEISMMVIIDRKLDKMATKVDTLDPVTSVARGAEWDAQTLHSWLAANTRCRR